jgi:hypothetical protein
MPSAMTGSIGHPPGHTAMTARPARTAAACAAALPSAQPTRAIEPAANPAARPIAPSAVIHASEAQALAGHHLAGAADFAQRLEKDVERAAPECLDMVERELPNIRAALDHAASAPDPDHNGLRLMTALAFFRRSPK